MGRARSLQASSNASRWLCPSRSRSIAYSTSRIEFLAANPISIRKPISDGMPSMEPPNSSARNAPPTAVGSAIMMITGLKKLRNSNTITQVNQTDRLRECDEETERQLLQRLFLALRSHGRAGRRVSSVIGNASTLFSASPSCTPPVRSARMVRLRLRSKRLICAGPA